MSLSYLPAKRNILRRVSLALALALCLQVLAGSVSTASADASGMIRVKLSVLGTPSSITFRTSGTYNAAGHALASGSTVVVSASGGELTLTSGGSTLASGRSIVVNRSGTGTSCGVRFTSPSLSNLYCGDLIFTASGSGIQTVLRIYVETYLYGVLPYEMSNTYPLEALKAQAVAARTYAMRAKSSSGSYDLSDNASSQVFRGYSAAYANAISAVNATKGVCLTISGSYARCYYTASNGGQTESAKNAWGSSVSYLAVRDDPYDLANPASLVKSATIHKDGSRLNAILSAAILKAAADQLKGAGLGGASVRTINAAQLHSPRFADPSRTYTKLRLNVTFEENGKTGTFDVNLSTYGGLESALGLSINSDSNETVSIAEQEDAYVLEFRRYGHGVGLSQRGAQWMAKNHGMSYSQILDFYYPGTAQTTFALSDVISTSQSAAEPTPTPVPVESEYGYTTLQPGDSGEAVKAMQARLKELGYFTGTPLGNYKTLTETAVRAFQDAKGLTVDGVATPYVQKLIFEGGAPDVTGTPEPTATPEPTPTPSSSAYAMLSYGDTGEAVKALQRRLKELGYFTGNIGGNYLTLTQSAVEAYQRANGLAVDGVATSALQERIFGTSAAPQATETASPTSTPAPTATAAPTPAPTDVPAARNAVVSLGNAASRLNVRKSATTSSEIVGTLASGASVVVTGTSGDWSEIASGGLAGYVMTQYLKWTDTASPTMAPSAAPAATPDAAPSGYATLRYGDTGEAVKALQRRLKELGYFTGNIGGNYLTLTQSAVEAYQRANGLTVDGVATSALQQRLFEAPAATARASEAPQPTTKPTTETTAYVRLGSDTARLNIRRSPSTSSDILGTLASGAAVTVTGVSGDWSMITANGIVGYVKSSYLSYEQPASAPTSAPRATEAPKPAATEAPSGQTTLGPGDTGEAVKALQRKLKELGYFTGSIGGNYLTLTEGAVKAFQEANGLKADGIATPEVQRMIFAAAIPTTPETGDSTNATVDTGSGDYLNMRASASASASRIARLSSGTRVTVLASEGDWYKISWNGKTGYVIQSCIRKD